MASVFHFGLLLLISGQLLLTATALPKPKGVERKCDPGWVRGGKSCMKLSQVPATWKDAEALCVSDNAHLVSFKDIKDLTALKFMVRKKDETITSVWTGAVFVSENGAWMWIDGSPVPKNFLKYNDQIEGFCMAMNMSGKGKQAFQQSKCDESLPYVCSKDM